MAILSIWKRNIPAPCYVDSLHSSLSPGYVEGTLIKFCIRKKSKEVQFNSVVIYWNSKKHFGNVTNLIWALQDIPTHGPTEERRG